MDGDASSGEFEWLLDQAFTPLLSQAGFQRSGACYLRRHGETVQAISLEAEAAASSLEIRSVDVGVAFDALCKLLGESVPERLDGDACDRLGLRDRVGSLPGTAGGRWTLRAGDDSSRVVRELQRQIEVVVRDLNRLNGLAAYREHPWFDVVRPMPVNAQILYLLGDWNGARQQIESLVKLYSGNGEAKDPEQWIAELRLAGLADEFG